MTERSEGSGGPTPGGAPGSGDLRGRTFEGVDLQGARFVESNLRAVVMRGVDVDGMEIDAPWLGDDGGLVVNGVDVAAFVHAELDRRFPGRAERRATDPEGLRSAWAAVERAWAATLERVESLPAGTVDVSVDGEWTFAETLRHLVMATDTWLRKAIQGVEQPYHPIGRAYTSFADPSVFADGTPPYAEVLAVRAERMAMVRDVISGVTPEELAAERSNPHAPEYPETVLSCLHTIIEEEWEHHRFAVRDLDAIAARGDA